KIKQGFKPALFYMFALTPLVFGTIDFILNLFGAFTNFNRNFNPITLGLVFESVIISFGILYRYNLFKKEKELLAIELSEQKAITTNKVIEAQELERKRIAQDLHDELGGDLATIKINLQNALNEDTAIVNALSLLDKASSDLRNISHNLMPPDFSKMRLNENLISLYKELNQRSII
ncbi:MAG: histidine kinase, partial [Bacteroidota bacterium]|nr:histidine kinase [Bacteroidota bacterium]